MEPDDPLADVEGLLCEVLGKAGQPDAVAEAVRIVERLEVGRSKAHPEQWAAFDEAIERALRTVRVVRSYVEPIEPEPERPPLVPLRRRMTRPCGVRRRA